MLHPRQPVPTRKALGVNQEVRIGEIGHRTTGINGAPLAGGIPVGKDEVMTGIIPNHRDLGRETGAPVTMDGPLIMHIRAPAPLLEFQFVSRIVHKWHN